MGAVVNIDPLGCDLAGAQKFHLLGLAVRERSRVLQCVEMLVVEGFLLQLAAGGNSSIDTSASHRGEGRLVLPPEFVYIPGHRRDPTFSNSLPL